ncbi:MAG: preprotein translocase subunit YajC [Tidjanibacter sp.]|nr:preprotein translocase subunit YajC [Tidjanibacter sp.]
MTMMTMFLQAAAQPAAGSNMSFLIMMVLIFGVMWLFMIRPQQKRQKELQKFRDSLKRGDKIISAGGIYGTVKEVKESYILMEVDNNVSIRIDKSMVMQAPADLQQQ